MRLCFTTSVDMRNFCVEKCIWRKQLQYARHQHITQINIYVKKKQEYPVPGRW